jgi:ATP-dependent Clp protease protease subunit
MNPDVQPQARYILPSFVEHSSWGVKESNPYNKLFEERIIFLGVQVDDASANDIMAQLLVLESLDPDRDITMYINSPGGGFTSLMAIYDTMQYVRADIQTCAWARPPRPRRCCWPPARRVSGWRCLTREC